MHSRGCTSTAEILENWFYLQTGSTRWTNILILFWKDRSSWEKEYKLYNSASSCATKQQATSTATATKTPEFPPISASAKFYTERTWTQVQRSEPVPGFNKASTSIHSGTRGSLQNSVYWRQSQLNRNHFFQDGVANEAGSEKQWTCFWGVFVLVLYLQETNLRERKFS